MSQRDVEGILGRLVTDSQVRQRFFAAPEETAVKESYSLSADEIASLLQVGEAPLLAFAASVDGSIMRAVIVPDGIPARLSAGGKL